MLLSDLIRSSNESIVLSSDLVVNVDSTVLNNLILYNTIFAVITGFFIGFFLMLMFAYVVLKNQIKIDGNNETNNLESNNPIRVWNIPPESDIVD